MVRFTEWPMAGGGRGFRFRQALPLVLGTIAAVVAACGGASKTMGPPGGGGGTSQFTVTLRYITALTPTQQAAFSAAKARWEQIITGDLTNVPVNLPADAVTKGSPAINETVDDLLILVKLDSIDGPGGTLGQAGPRYIRQSGTGLPVVGLMEFDTADVATFAADLNTIVLHEMGHVLGFGTLAGWDQYIVGPALKGGTDAHFVGTNALSLYNSQNNGAFYNGGPAIPLETTPLDSGTADAHWRETVFNRELMTGFLDPGQPQPLSATTVGALKDLGYVVDPTKANPFNLASPYVSGAAISAQGVAIREKILHPMYQVDDAGRVFPVPELRQ